ncbi:MAG: VIT family protein, partial [Frankiaceae bacterium]|nr:VIT family protein [Frankiaceae bacterium]
MTSEPSEARSDASQAGPPSPADHKPGLGPGDPRPTHVEQHAAASRLNWLRAGVLGANDGIVATAGIVVGVAGANGSRSAIATAGVAGLVAGAVSMALGEYVSVSTQRDTERAQMALETWELANLPEEELAELEQIYRDKGLSPDTARIVAKELTEHDALAAHLDAELHLDPDDLTNPTHAAVASAIAFTLGSVLPLIALLATPPTWRGPVTIFAVVAARAIAGVGSARLG